MAYEDKSQPPPLSSKVQKVKQILYPLVIFVAWAGVIVLIYQGFKFSWPLWILILLIFIWVLLLFFLIKALRRAPGAGFQDKKLWDWLNLLGTLAVPLILGVATLIFSQQQAQSSLDQQQATILQTYIGNIQDLLLHDGLQGATQSDEVAIVARARTLAALQELDPYRRGVLVQFLYASKLIGSVTMSEDCIQSNTIEPIINMSQANLTGAILDNAPLTGANLNGANLTGAMLDDTLQLHFVGSNLPWSRFGVRLSS